MPAYPQMHNQYVNFGDVSSCNYTDTSTTVSKKQLSIPAMSSRIIAQSILWFFLLFYYDAYATITENVVESIFWDGIGAYIPVDRQIIQRKLDTWYDSDEKICKGKLVINFKTK